MSGPATICLKRKAGEDPPEHLLVQKRQISEVVGEEIRYTLKRKETELLFQNLAPSEPASTATSRPSSREERRTFHLTRTLTPSGVQKRKDGKRKREEMLTVEERRVASKFASPSTSSKHTAAGNDDMEDVKPLKRPGKGSATRRPAPPVPIDSDDDDDQKTKQRQEQRRMESLANDLHAFALAELANAPKPKLTAVPKLSAARSRQIHQQRTAASPTPPRPRTTAADTDYVYDTYVLAPALATTASDAGAVGYVILGEDDESVWEMFLEAATESEDALETDEDENAEAWYGADYPEDEMAEDDARGGGAYGYRGGGGSDWEGWEGEEEEEEEGEEEEEEGGLEREMRAWRGRGRV